MAHGPFNTGGSGGNAADLLYDDTNSKLEATNVQAALDKLCSLIADLEFIHIGTTAPEDTTMLWIDTTTGRIPKYYNGTGWVAVNAVWAE